LRRANGGIIGCKLLFNPVRHPDISEHIRNNCGACVVPGQTGGDFNVNCTSEHGSGNDPVQTCRNGWC
jgi:hypothetical protein